MTINKQTIRAARRVVRAELDSYDQLSRKPKITRRESLYQESQRRSDVDRLGPDRGYVCGHRISLTLPCPHCNRTAQDCVEYITALRFKLAELLKVLKA